MSDYRTIGPLVFNFNFSDFNKKHNRCAVCPKYVMKRGLFGPVTKVLTKNMTAEVAKSITNGH